MSRRQYVFSRIHFPVVLNSTSRANPHSHGERESIHNMAALRAEFAARKESVHEPELPAVPGAFIGQHLPETEHARVGDAAREAARAHHASHIKVLDTDHVETPDKTGSLFRKVVLSAVANPGMQPGHTQALAEPASAAFLSSRERALETGEPLKPPFHVLGIGQMLPIGERGQAVDSQVYPHAVTRLGKRFHGFIQAEARKVTPAAVLGYRNRGGRTRELPGPADTQVPKLGESEVRLLRVPPEGGTGELRALLSPPRLEAGIGRPLLKEVAVGRLQMPEALLERHTGDFLKPPVIRLLLPLGKGRACLGVAHPCLILPVTLFPHLERPVIHIADTPKGLSKGTPLGWTRVEPESVPHLHGTKSSRKTCPKQPKNNKTAIPPGPKGPGFLADQ